MQQHGGGRQIDTPEGAQRGHPLGELVGEGAGHRAVAKATRVMPSTNPAVFFATRLLLRTVFHSQIRISSGFV